jgi:hypothetical protein
MIRINTGRIFTFVVEFVFFWNWTVFSFPEPAMGMNLFSPWNSEPSVPVDSGATKPFDAA